MKITKFKLNQIIKEEIASMSRLPGANAMPPGRPPTEEEKAEFQGLPSARGDNYDISDIGNMLSDILNISSDERRRVYSMNDLAELATEIKNTIAADPGDGSSVYRDEETEDYVDLK